MVPSVGRVKVGTAGGLVEDTSSVLCPSPESGTGNTTECGPAQCCPSKVMEKDILCLASPLLSEVLTNGRQHGMDLPHLLSPP